MAGQFLLIVDNDDDLEAALENALDKIRQGYTRSVEPSWAISEPDPPILTGRLKKSEVLWIHSMGKRFQVRAMFPNTEAGTRNANSFMEKNRDTGLIATIGGVQFVANLLEGVYKENDDNA